MNKMKEDEALLNTGLKQAHEITKHTYTLQK